MRSSLRRLARRVAESATLAASPAMAAAITRLLPDDQAYQIFYARGFHLLRQHYYLPIPDVRDVRDGFWERESELVGVDINEFGALDVLENVVAAHADEFRAQFPLDKAGANGFYLLNGNFMAVDAHVYYALIRHFRPTRVIEIGSGFSTMLAGAACLANQRHYGVAPQLVAIEPFPSSVLKAGLGGLSELVQAKVQDVPLELFTSLRAGDIVFIDSSHVLREGGDVQFEFCEILPRLAPGVLVHVHDISLPRPYPRVYFERRLYWNEQYLLQAFLTFNTHFEVIWPGNYMLLRHHERLTEVLPEYHAMRAAFPSSEPASFWLRVRTEASPTP